MFISNIQYKINQQAFIDEEKKSFFFFRHKTLENVYFFRTIRRVILAGGPK